MNYSHYRIIRLQRTDPVREEYQVFYRPCWMWFWGSRTCLYTVLLIFLPLTLVVASAEFSEVISAIANFGWQAIGVCESDEEAVELVVSDKQARSSKQVTYL